MAVDREGLAQSDHTTAEDVAIEALSILSPARRQRSYAPIPASKLPAACGQQRFSFT